MFATTERGAAQTTTVIWSATLTVDDTGVGAGCDNTDPQQDDCSNALTDSDFTFGGVTYTFESVLWYNEDGLVSVKFDTGSASAHKTALASLTLNLPGAALAINDAAVDTSLNDLSWNYDPTPDWAEGDDIAMSLTGPAASTPTTPTTPTTPSAGADTIWSATLTADVDATGDYFGCDNNDGSQDNCSTALTEDELTLSGTTYTIVQLFWRKSTDSLEIGFTPAITVPGSFALVVNGSSLLFSSASTGLRFSWNYDPSPDWADGDTVALSITRPAPSTPTTSNPTSATTSGGRPIQVDGSSIAGWSIEEGSAKKKVGTIGATAASIPKTRWTFSVNTLVTQFSSGMSVLTPATNYFTVADNGRVSYTGRNPRVSGRTYTGMGTAHLTITISDSKEKASDVRVTIPIAMQAQPTLSAVENSTGNCSIIETIADKNVCKIRVAEIGDKRTKFVIEDAGSEFYDDLTSILTIDEATGKISYDGSAVVEQAKRARAKYPHRIDIDIAVSDKKNKFAELELTIYVAVTQVRPARLVATGAPYRGWQVEAGEADDNIGTVYGHAIDGDLVAISRSVKLRYEIIQAVDLDKAGDERGRALLVGSKHAAFKIGKATGVVSYTGERIEGEQVRMTIQVSDKKNLAPPIQIMSYVQVDPPPPLLTYNEANPAPAVWRGPVNDACPAKPGHVNFGGSPTIIDLQQPSPAPLLDPAERYVTVPATCNYVTDEAHREYCAVPSRWRKDFCRGWSPPDLANSES